MDGRLSALQAMRLHIREGRNSTRAVHAESRTDKCDEDEAMTSLLLCWYSLGWVACGVVFAKTGRLYSDQMYLCFIAPPFILFAFAIILFVDNIQLTDQPTQYLWRKK
jgi:hypothetical protein